MLSAREARDPLFVGGTGRSGTHVMARLVGRHSRYHYISRELHFHVDRGGLADLLAGRVSLRRFVRNMRRYWWERPSVRGGTTGLSGKVPRATFDAALADFERNFDRDPAAAATRLMRSLLDPLADEARKPSWVEQTPWNVARAPALVRLFPGAKLIHMVRDGRDVACSLTTRKWGPSSPMRGLRWWERRMRLAGAGERAVGADRVLVMNLEDLLLNDRDGSYRRMLEFLGLEDEPRLRRYFERKLKAEDANLGRWQELSESQQRRITAAYARSLERLHAAGVASAPDPTLAGVPASVGRGSTGARVAAMLRR